MSSASISVKTIPSNMALKTFNDHRRCGDAMQCTITGMKLVAFRVFASVRRYNWHRMNPDNAEHLNGSTLFKVEPPLTVTPAFVHGLTVPYSQTRHAEEDKFREKRSARWSRR